MPEVQLNFGTMRRYMPAVLKSNTNGFYIEYYAYNQITDGLERKRMKLKESKKLCGVPFNDNANDYSNQLPVGKQFCR